MIIRKLDGPPFVKQQCQLPKEDLRDLGWAGYRERRTRINRLRPETCMRHARWEVDGVLLCSTHAGIKVLEEYKS